MKHELDLVVGANNKIMCQGLDDVNYYRKWLDECHKTQALSAEILELKNKTSDREYEVKYKKLRDKLHELAIHNFSS
jgi:hypothetical protein